MILLPVLNEAEGLEAVLGTIPVESLEERGWTSDIVIVDGNSTDTSREIGVAAGCNVLVQPNHGKGEAVRLGFNYAIKNKYDALVMFDADQTYDPIDMLAMLDEPDQGGVIVGNRLNSSMTNDAMSPTNWVGNHLLTWSAVLLHGLDADPSPDEILSEDKSSRTVQGRPSGTSQRGDFRITPRGRWKESSDEVLAL